MLTRCRAASLLVAITLAACAEPPVTPGAPGISAVGAVAFGYATVSTTYLLNSTGDELPSGLAASVAAAGGSLVTAYDAAGIAIAESSDPNFAAKAEKISGILNVGPDGSMVFSPPARSEDVFESTGDEAGATSATTGTNETFRAAQWAPDAINAPGAWALNAVGNGARVAIVDGGVWNRHLDIRPNLDSARSMSFVPGFFFYEDVGTFWHGTHVAGIVAAPSNSIGTVGIAPEATLVSVKVLHNGSGNFSWVIAGMIYAATPLNEGGPGVHIMNLSLGTPVGRGGAGIAHFLTALSKAANYARKRGVLVVAAVGNDGVDLDHSKSTMFVPAQSGSSISVSATGPLGFGLGATNYDRPASYTNFGQKAVELAGPGGDFAFPGTALCTKPTQPAGSITTQCWVFDMVMAPCRGAGASIGSYCFSAGTSMAAPAVSGVAALVVGKYGPLSPVTLETILRQSADDLGKPGNDDFYGKGRVNALRAVGGT